jgi:hypothetical protein
MTGAETPVFVKVPREGKRIYPFTKVPEKYRECTKLFFCPHDPGKFSDDLFRAAVKRHDSYPRFF